MIYAILIRNTIGQSIIEKIFSSMIKATIYVHSIIECINAKFTLIYNSDRNKRWQSDSYRIDIKSYNAEIDDYVYILSFSNIRGISYVENIFVDMTTALRYVKASYKYSSKRYVLKYSNERRKSWRSATGKIDIIRHQIE